MKTVLVLGGSSFIGIPLLRRLAQHKGWEIVSTYYQHQPALNRVEWRKLDATDKNDLNKLLNQLKPAIVINCIALSDVDACEKNKDLCRKMNVTPTEIIVEYCQKNPSTHYIFFSSSQVFDGKQKDLYKESDSPNPLNYYGTAKAQSEELVKKCQKYTIIRPCLVFGIPLSFQHRNIFNHVYKGLTTDKRVTGYRDMIRNPCYVEDIPLMVERIMELNKRGIFHAGGEVMTMYHFAVRIALFFRLDTKLIMKEDSLEQNRPKNNALDCESTKNELGIKFRSLSESLEDIKKKLEVAI